DEPLDVLALDRVLGALATADPLLAELAGLHLFGGLGFAEIAELRGVSERTVFRDWRAARMFLLRYMDATG
ncbi:MAG TPA: ECF-type sigma factor, partial [Tahibacter sp.]|nr:ECF-type sigma factor [Tahibacter sp.]